MKSLYRNKPLRQEKTRFLTYHHKLKPKSDTNSVISLWLYSIDIHWSGINLWPLTGEVNNTDYLFIMAPVSGWYIWQQVNMLSSLEAEQMGKCKYLSEFDKG